MKDKIILLDLNSTLAYREDGQSTVYHYHRIDEELYREELIAAVKCFTIVLITVRPIRHKEETLANIKRQLNFVPDMALFKDNSTLKPPEIKKEFLFNIVFKKYGDRRNQYLALESNRVTRAMYHAQGIKAIRGDSPYLKHTLNELKKGDLFFP